MVARYALDAVRDDNPNPDRRGWMIKITDRLTVEALHEIDELVIKKAIECSREWFGHAN